MRRIQAIIEKGKDGRFSVRTDFKIGNSYPGGFGDSVEEAKADFLESVGESVEEATADGFKVAEEYDVMYSYDMPSFFNYFNYINVGKFASFAGINESKMRQYKCGLAFPGEKTAKKIANALIRIGNEFAHATI